MIINRLAHKSTPEWISNPFPWGSSVAYQQYRPNTHAVWIGSSWATHNQSHSVRVLLVGGAFVADNKKTERNKWTNWLLLMTLPGNDLYRCVTFQDLGYLSKRFYQGRGGWPNNNSIREVSLAPQNRSQFDFFGHCKTGVKYPILCPFHYFCFYYQNTNCNRTGAREMQQLPCSIRRCPPALTPTVYLLLYSHHIDNNIDKQNEIIWSTCHTTMMWLHCYCILHYTHSFLPFQLDVKDQGLDPLAPLTGIKVTQCNLLLYCVAP